METIKSIFEILNSNLGGLFVLASLGYGLFKSGQFWQVFKAMPELVGDVTHLKVDVVQLKNDVAELKTDVHQIKGDIALIKQKLGV